MSDVNTATPAAAAQQPQQVDPRITLGNGLYLLISPVVKECDAKIQEVYQSQKNLSEQIDSLSNQLDQFNSLTQIPTLHPHIQKLLNARGRLLAINSKLTVIMGRMDKLSATVLQQQQQKTSVTDRISGFFKSSNKPATPTKPQQNAPVSQVPASTGVEATPQTSAEQPPAAPVSSTVPYVSGDVQPQAPATTTTTEASNEQSQPQEQQQQQQDTTSSEEAIKEQPTSDSQPQEQQQQQQE
ncbi:hypothetical protein SAMD00019534_079250 [Acytostelium subglobosum LB1]|uniref:hypothetical protein n=1 Tax=Acytostelium subglobosum LB1 TaxID=1410327 RepID=UPI000644B6BF|nr:hypothetical protein SAMD00019534_079250 [Acytostelium subglobosum LB1]GAM24750.1 hypothetical protein SAMD00019534_079250 [Acytostelium subglobosum LB1]|eukprot:XP_012752419.1 hypothetical protein SAMD00019534_079250 [Acytostelium subglobosum LB1]